jgi:ABC-type transporter Mla subunit MlaD
LSDDNDPKKTLTKLKTASKALKSAQRASRETVKEVNRAKRAVAEADKKLERFEHPKIRSRRKR